MLLYYPKLFLRLLEDYKMFHDVFNEVLNWNENETSTVAQLEPHMGS